MPKHRIQIHYSRTRERQHAPEGMLVSTHSTCASAKEASLESSRLLATPLAELLAGPLAERVARAIVAKLVHAVCITIWIPCFGKGFEVCS